MKDVLKKAIRWILCSFERCNTGASSRKLTMFALVGCVIFLHYIVGNIFINGTINDTKAILWVLTLFLLIDCVTILLIMQILKPRDIIEMVDNIEINQQKTNESRTTEETETI
jgi:hypothetical protein